MQFFANYWYVWTAAFIGFALLTYNNKKAHAKILTVFDMKGPSQAYLVKKIESALQKNTLILIFFFIMMCAGIAMKLAALS